MKHITKKQREEMRAKRMEQDGARVRAIMEKPPVEKPPARKPRTTEYVEPTHETPKYWAELLG